MNERLRPRAIGVVVALALILGNAATAAAAPTDPIVVAISAGGRSSCAVLADGRVKCWGDNQGGQLGNGSKPGSATPVDVAGLPPDIASVATSSTHTCALTRRGGVLCWGSNYNGALGDGSHTDSLAPIQVTGLTSGATAVAVDVYGSCALTDPGAVLCWGITFRPGPATTVPADVGTLTHGMAAIAIGWSHSCGVTDASGVLCWGLNEEGELGPKTGQQFSDPSAVPGVMEGVTSVATGQRHTCAALVTGGARCWGSNRYAQLGDGTQASSALPVAVAGLSGTVSALAGGSRHACSLVSGGTTCWGQNAFGQLGNGVTAATSPPVAVAGLSRGVTAIAAGEARTCAIASGHAFCWGQNAYGQLGNGSTTKSNVPTKVDFAPRFTIEVRSSETPGRIAAGTAVTFIATAGPLFAASAVTVRFEIFRRDGAVWRRSAHRDLGADSSGHATLRWTFVTPGQRMVRAMVLGDSRYAASHWSSALTYGVVGG